MDMRIYPSELTGSIKAVASKSEAHRLLICAAFADGVTDIDCNTTSADIDATASCLRALGAQVTRTKLGFRVSPARTARQGALLDCGESGSTLRFLLPVVAALGCDARLTGHGRLPERPLSPLYEELAAHGCKLGEKGVMPLGVGGKLRSGRFEIAGNVSSQYVSGLLMAAPLMDEDTEVFVTEPIESLPYVDITCQALSRFGVKVSREKHEEEGHCGLLFKVSGASSYTTPGTVAVGGDWSNAAFWLAAGAFSETGIEVTGLDVASTQGDRAVLAAIALLGGGVVRGREGAATRCDGLRGCTLDVKSCPDLVPPLAAVAALAKGTTKITGAARLRIKESDRLKTVSAAINALGGHVEETQDGLVIDGADVLSGGVVDATNDHRIAMMSAILATRAKGASTIRGAECVAKSYPAFFEDLRALGGRCEEV